MRSRKAVALLACVMLFAAGAALGEEADLGAAAKAVVAKHAAAVVPLKVVVSTKMTYQGREMPSQEREIEALGTVLDETGLIVASYFAVDPAGASATKRPEDKIDSEIKSAKLVQKDGTELTLKVVLRDAQLDLIFLRPEKKTPLAHVGLVKSGPELGLTDGIVVLARLGAVGDRQPAVFVGRVESVIDKPRRLYVTISIGGNATLGCPVFTDKGELVGVSVVRLTLKEIGGQLRANLLPAILPVADVIEDMKQIEKPEEQK